MSLVAQGIVVEELCSLLGVPALNLDHGSSFLSLGGHSLSAVRLAGLCKKRGVRLFVDRIIRSNSLSEIIQSAELQETSPQVHQPIPEPVVNANDWLDQVEAAGVDFRIDIRRQWDLSSGRTSSEQPPAAVVSTRSTTHSANVAALVPASELQLSLIHGSVKNPGTNIIQHFETYRPEDVPVMKEAWRKVFELEPILSTRYSADFLPQRTSNYEWTEVTTEDPARFDELLHEAPSLAVVGCSWKVLTLTAATRPKINPKSVIIWTIHHALIDGFSAELLFAKVRRASAGKPIFPGPSFADLSNQLQILREQRKAEGDAFWKQQQEVYARAATTLQLPLPLEPEGGCGDHSIDVGLSPDALGEIAKQCNVTPAAIFHTAWALVMSLYADCDDVVFGVVLSGRNLPLAGIEDAIGPFVNTLPLVVSLNRESRLKDLAVDVFQRMTELAQYQWTTPENGFSRHFQSALAMQFDFAPVEEEGPVCSIEQPYSKQATDIPLSLSIEQRRICLQYFRNEFRRADVELLGSLYRQAIMAFTHLDTIVGTCQASLMTLDSHQIVRRNGNCLSGSTLSSSVTDDLVTLFERTVQMHPANVAVEIGTARITYGKLNEAVNSVAYALNPYVRHGDVVCVHADRSMNWIVAIFGILKTGAVYCALDTAVPAELRSSMFKQSGAKVFLAPRLVGINTAPSESQVNLVVETILSEKRPHDLLFASRPSPIPSSTAYICFTSGSTGTPKGVICTHEGLVAFQRDLEVRLFAQPGVKVSQLMSVAFDGSIHEIFSALCYGATLILPEGENLFEILTFAHSAILTPSVAEVLEPEDFPNLKHVYLVGEPVKQSIADRWGAAKILYNMYGPTEGTCGATIKRLLPGHPVTIGHPNPSTRIYILNSKGAPVPPGMIGEIYVAGVQVARGYLGLPNITAERFLPDSICRGLGEFMYKTGDRGYWTADGEIVCLGRNDRQIKLRGFRLDLNDLEVRVAKAVPDLKSVAIAPREDFLVAAIQPSSLDAALVATLIAKVLPVYARPRHLVFVDKFPMTKAGKLDYKQITSDSFINCKVDKSELRTPTEIKIASVWRQLLKLGRAKHIGPKSNFLELGGNSLLQMTLLARLSSTFKFKIPLKVIIESQSLGELASELDKLKVVKKPSEGRSQTLGPRKLSRIEEDWWEKYRLNQTTSAFNVSFVGTFSPDIIYRVALADAWNTVMSRYSIFRGRYVACRRSKVERRYIEHAPRVQRVRKIDIWAEVNRPFDLTNTSAIRVFLSEDTLLVTLSHIVADLTTLNILLREVKTLYHGETLEPVYHTYEDSVVWDDDAPICDLKFWTAYLEDCPRSQVEQGCLPERRSYRGTSKVYELPQALSAGMLAFAPANNMSLQQIAIAAVALALQPQTDDTDIVLGSPFINRSTEADLETVGLFLEPLPVRIRHNANSNDLDSKSFLKDVCKSAKAALGHAVPWNKLLEQLDLPRDYPNNPLFDVMVTFHDSNSAVKLDITGLSPCFTWAEGSKFTLMAEFTSLETGKIILRVEYDNEQYSADAITGIVGSILQAISMLVSNMSYIATKTRLREGRNTELMPVERSDLFGVPLREI